jgi:hypothetical protein
MSSASWLIQGQGIKKEEYIEDPMPYEQQERFECRAPLG